MSALYDITVKTNALLNRSMGEYKGKVLLIVNTASKCGFTPQYDGLQALYAKHREEGFELLAFPCNQFMEQEPGDNSAIKEFCSVNFNITFPIFDKVDVKGDAIHPLYAFLTTAKRGILGTKAVKWNFTKFLVDRTGNVVKRYAPATKPEKIEGDIEKLLREK
ncbi:MAG: glutathione peroxidase [Spirochaetae bacterium HGW-Spirochaetae-1]|jgi:glutathione peroxidase|nr:MAG: glutathione peroxidase [Spirochaetae bacterium HGW-Spirochaetae-1]